MPITRILGAILLILGLGAVIYGGFIYSPEAAEIVIGPLEMSVGEAEQVNTPLWSGIIALIAGVVLLLLPTESREPARG